MHRVEVGRGQRDVEPAQLPARLPDGPHDAESLFADRAGRLHVITKSFGGGTVYRAPTRLRADASTGSSRSARVRGYVTDAALLRDGRHVLVRSLQQATVYTMPDLDPVGVVRAAVAAAGRGDLGRARRTDPDQHRGCRHAGATRCELPAAVARTMRRPAGAHGVRLAGGRRSAWRRRAWKMTGRRTRTRPGWAWVAAARSWWAWCHRAGRGDRGGGRR